MYRLRVECTGTASGKNTYEHVQYAKQHRNKPRSGKFFGIKWVSTILESGVQVAIFSQDGEYMTCPTLIGFNWYSSLNLINLTPHV